MRGLNEIERAFSLALLKLELIIIIILHRACRHWFSLEKSTPLYDWRFIDDEVVLVSNFQDNYLFCEWIQSIIRDRNFNYSITGHGTTEIFSIIICQLDLFIHDR